MKMPYKLFLIRQACRSSPWPQNIQIRTFFLHKKITIFQGPTSKMGATPTEFGVRPPKWARRPPKWGDAQPESIKITPYMPPPLWGALGAPGGPLGAPGGPWGPMGALGPMGPWAPWARCAAGMREAQFTLVDQTV